MAAGVSIALMAILFTGIVISRDETEYGGFERNRRVLASPQYNGGSFVNPNGVTGTLFSRESLDVAIEYLLTERVDIQPKVAIPVAKIDPAQWTGLPRNEFKYAWLGHSSVLIAIDGNLILADPVFEERASPISWMGPKRFHPSPVTAETLPPLDAVLITHDHYDHLEELTISKLAGKTGLFLVPLGIGALLEKWGVPREKIAELDWWEAREAGSLTFTATSAVHYSSRGLFDLNQRLWLSWTITGKEKQLFISGDSGYFGGFRDIAKKLGPMDVTFLKIGAYNDKGTWRQLHMTPEEAVAEHMDLSGGQMVPLHWATFDLALHSWYEPMERAMTEAKRLGVNIATPKVGQVVIPDGKGEIDYWWRSEENPE